MQILDDHTLQFQLESILSNLALFIVTPSGLLALTVL